MQILNSAKCSEIFGADLRSLAALRIGVALLLIVDLIMRSRDLVAHYTDFGIVPRKALLEQLRSRWLVSIHLANGTWEFQAVLFTIAGIFGVALFLGYRTRLATIASFILLASLDTRNPTILDGGDTLLRLVLFWAIFLPWGSRYSVDSALQPVQETGGKTYVVSCATFAYLAQIIFLYWFSVLHKTGVEWGSDGTAVYYALNIDKMVTPFGHYLLQFPVLMRPLTYAIYWFEVIGPLMLISPFLTGPVRTLVVIGFVLLHAGIGACLKIGIFPWIGAISALGLLPSWAWEKANALARSSDTCRLRFLYDENCSLCCRSMRLVQTFLLLPQAEFIPTGSEVHDRSDLHPHHCWKVIDGEEKYMGFQAWVLALERSVILWPLALFFKLTWIKGWAVRSYSRVSHHRVIQRAPSSPITSSWRFSRITNVVVVGLIAYVFVWNWTDLPNSKIKMSERAQSVGFVLRLDQKWNLFAPYPLKDDGWYVIQARLKDSTIVDVYRSGVTPTPERPASISSTYKNYRWRKYLDNLLNFPNYRAYYGDYLCRDWNFRHPPEQSIKELDIIYMLEWTLPDYQTPRIQPALVLKHICEAGQRLEKAREFNSLF